MTYDETLAARVRELLRGRRSVAEKEQFGGIGFMIGGNMAVGVLGKDLLVRVGPEKHEAAMQSKHARPFSLTGRPARGWVLVGPAGLASKTNLAKWAELGVTFAKTLPRKEPGSRGRRGAGGG
jgi:TfoX/Sxy family transcriptional regulator of competence genes